MEEPLTCELTTLDTSRPIVTPGKYDLLLVKSELAQSAAGDPMLKLEFATASPLTGMKGEPIAPGARIFDNIMLKPAGKSNWDLVLKGPHGLGSYVQAAGFTGTGIRPDNAETWHLQAQGRTILCDVGFEAERTDPKSGKRYPAGNTIEGFIKR